MLKAIAIDDEPAALEVIAIHAAEVPFLDLKARFTNPLEAVEYLKQNDVDLIFLDINMPKVTGFQLSNILGRNYPVIFTTAYAEYATLAFDYEAIDYLMKPITFERFLKACARANKLIATPSVNAHVEKTETTDSIFIRCDRSWRKICFKDLHYVMSDGNYVKFFLQDETIMARYKLMQIIGLLPASQFIQTHRRYVVNLSLIDQHTQESITIQDAEIPLGRAFQKTVFERIHGKLQ